MQDEEFKKKVLAPIDYAELEKLFGIPETATNLKEAIKDIICQVRTLRMYGSIGFGHYTPSTFHLDSVADINVAYQVAVALEIPVNIEFSDVSGIFSAEFDAGAIDKDFAGIKVRSISVKEIIM